LTHFILYQLFHHLLLLLSEISDRLAGRHLRNAGAGVKKSLLPCGRHSIIKNEKGQRRISQPGGQLKDTSGKAKEKKRKWEKKRPNNSLSQDHKREACRAPG
jgi:hypothetical protein